MLIVKKMLNLKYKKNLLYLFLKFRRLCLSIIFFSQSLKLKIDF